VRCIVRGFLETSAHKSHRYISRYPEIFEKKSRLIVRKIRYIFLLVVDCLVVVVNAVSYQERIELTSYVLCSLSSNDHLDILITSTTLTIYKLLLSHLFVLYYYFML